MAESFVATSVQLQCVEAALELGQAEAAQRHLARARSSVGDGLEEARRSVWLLRPRALEAGLPGAIATLARLSGHETVVEVTTTGPPRALPPAVESTLLRIGQEAVSNACKHARAARVAVALHFAPRTVQLTVEDDGQGLAPAAAGGDARGGFGMAGLRERAAEVGGRLDVQSAPGRGTRITFEVAG
jgi:signal transduction histidine kinase